MAMLLPWNPREKGLPFFRRADDNIHHRAEKLFIATFVADLTLPDPGGGGQPRTFPLLFQFSHIIDVVEP